MRPKARAAKTSYQRLKEKLLASGKRTSKAGRKTEDEVWARVNELFDQGLKGKVIKARCDREFGFERTVKAYGEGRRRYLARQKATK